MLEQDDLASRLRAAGDRWTTVSGTFRTWRDQPLVTRAFMEWHGLDEQGAGRNRMRAVAVHEMPDAGPKVPVEHLLRVHAAERGRRRRAEALSRVGEMWMDDLVVVDEPWFWSRNGHRVQTNHGDRRTSHGGADFFLLLTPTDVPDGFDLSATDETETVAGRACDLVVATPKERDPRGCTPGAEVFDMVSGGREFRFHLDQETSTLMRVTKLVDGAPAEVNEFLDIAFDEPVDDRLFQPLT
ncbi:hypothetical protein [Nocardioides sp. SR21]|uniref:hypothetical protein n=1 Tax=Nocardioides sp. SR21 TaxID=2919501 RepID=UPI001FA9D221|nr:hypothetical protein [Nocardioides sp. SR21]